MGNPEWADRLVAAHRLATADPWDQLAAGLVEANRAVNGASGGRSRADAAAFARKCADAEREYLEMVDAKSRHRGRHADGSVMTEDDEWQIWQHSIRTREALYGPAPAANRVYARADGPPQWPWRQPPSPVY